MPPPALIRLLALAILLGVCAHAVPASAYDTVLDAPLREVRAGREGRRGPVVGSLSAAVPTTIRFRDATHADVSFRTSAFEVRGSVDLAEGQARLRSARRIVLGGSPFRLEVEPGTSVVLTDGVRGEVALDARLPVAGLASPRWRVETEREASRADTRDAEPCAPVYLWAAPRVHGPVIRTAAHARLSFSASSRAGWSEVWVHEGGLALRGYTWMARHCGELGRLGTLGRAQVSGRTRELRALSAGSFVASSESAPWTVHILQPIEVELVRDAEHSLFVFPLEEGQVRVEGVIR